MKKNLVLAIFAIVGVLSSASSSQAAILSYQTLLSGPNEFPTNGSPGTGFATADYDDVAHTLTMHVEFQGLTGTTTASHIHSATTAPGFQNAGVATTLPSFIGFPLGVTSGTYDVVLDLTNPTSWNPSFVTNNGGTLASAEAALMNIGFAQGRAYLNIHSSTFSGGEIRGFWALVPEPSSLSLLALGVLALRRRRV